MMHDRRIARNSTMSFDAANNDRSQSEERIAAPSSLGEIG